MSLFLFFADDENSLRHAIQRIFDAKGVGQSEGSTREAPNNQGDSVRLDSVLSLIGCSSNEHLFPKL
jgi:hypothetical protein